MPRFLVGLPKVGLAKVGLAKVCLAKVGLGISRKDVAMHESVGSLMANVGEPSWLRAKLAGQGWLASPGSAGIATLHVERLACFPGLAGIALAKVGKS